MRHDSVPVQPTSSNQICPEPDPNLHPEGVRMIVMNIHTHIILTFLNKSLNRVYIRSTVYTGGNCSRKQQAEFGQGHIYSWLFLLNQVVQARILSFTVQMGMPGLWEISWCMLIKALLPLETRHFDCISTTCQWSPLQMLQYMTSSPIYPRFLSTSLLQSYQYIGYSQRAGTSSDRASASTWVAQLSAGHVCISQIKW